MGLRLKNILASGIVAGIVISLSAVTMVPVVGNEMDTVLAARGLPPLSNAAMAYFCCISLIFGIALVFLYAALNPGFGSWIKRAITVALIVWILAYLLNNISLAVYGFMPVRLVIIGSVWGLMELLLGSIVGSRLYEKSQKRNQG